MKIPTLASLEQQAIIGTRLSMIQDTETVNEEESIHNGIENVEGSDDDVKKPRIVYGEEDLLEQISKRSSVLEEMRRSQIQNDDEEMEVSVVEVEDVEDDDEMIEEATPTFVPVEETVPEEIRQEHTSIILKLDGSLTEKE